MFWLYFISQKLLSKATYSKSYKHTMMAVAAMQGADHQEQYGVQYLAQGHFNMQTRGIQPATSR